MNKFLTKLRVAVERLQNCDTNGRVDDELHETEPVTPMQLYKQIDHVQFLVTNKHSASVYLCVYLCENAGIAPEDILPTPLYSSRGGCEAKQALRH